MEAGTVTTERFLASKEARREGWAGGLSGDRGVGKEVGAEGGVGERTGGGGESGQFLRSSIVVSFLEVMVMDWKVVW